MEGKEINEVARTLLQEERMPLLVVTIPSLTEYGAAGYTIERYATALFNEWGIGSEERNYGMLLLVAVGDRKARIELQRMLLPPRYIRFPASLFAAAIGPFLSAAR